MGRYKPNLSYGKKGDAKLELAEGVLGIQSYP